MPQYVVSPSVSLSARPSVMFRYRDHIGWNTSKITSRLISFKKGLLLGLTLIWTFIVFIAVCLDTLDRISRICIQDIQPLDGFSAIPKCMTLNDPE